MVTMRDGVRLATDLYFPVGVKGAVPVILWTRGGYPKNAFRPALEQRISNSHPVDSPKGQRDLFRAFGMDHGGHSWLASQGYVVALQDARGKYDSEGSYTVVQHYREDIYDTIDWLSKQQWSTGKVGTIGCSYEGEVQLYMARGAHPALKAMIPMAAGTAIGSAGGVYSYAHSFDSGALQIAGMADWHYRALNKVRAQVPAGVNAGEWQAMREMFDLTPKIRPKSRQEWLAILNTLPEIDLLKNAGLEPGGVAMTDWREFVSHMNDVTHPFWKQFDFVEEGAVSNVPALFVTSWYDINPRSDLYLRQMFERTATNAAARQHQHILVSATPHCRWELATEDYRLGPLALGDARLGYYSIYLDWFDYWLKGRNSGIEALPKIQYYEMGANQWRASEQWPPAGTQFKKLYLHSAGRANSHFGDGMLSFEPPTAGQVADSFVYDPGNPVQSLAGPFCAGLCGEIVADQRANSARNDVLVYTTEPLRESLRITGPIDIMLSVASTAKDTDLAVTLVDVYPDGRALNIREDLRRVRYRNGRNKPELMTPGTVYQVPIQLSATSIELPAGHRLRVHVTSSSFPAWGRNLNTGGNNFDEVEWIVATNSIHHSGGNESYLVIPVSGGKP